MRIVPTSVQSRKGTLSLPLTAVMHYTLTLCPWNETSDVGSPYRAAQGRKGKEEKQKRAKRGNGGRKKNVPRDREKFKKEGGMPSPLSLIIFLVIYYCLSPPRNPWNPPLNYIVVYHVFGHICGEGCTSRCFRGRIYYELNARQLLIEVKTGTFFFSFLPFNHISHITWIYSIVYLLFFSLSISSRMR